MSRAFPFAGDRGRRRPGPSVEDGRRQPPHGRWSWRGGRRRCVLGVAGLLPVLRRRRRRAGRRRRCRRAGSRRAVHAEPDRRRAAAPVKAAEAVERRPSAGPVQGRSSSTGRRRRWRAGGAAPSVTSPPVDRPAARRARPAARHQRRHHRRPARRQRRPSTSPHRSRSSSVGAGQQHGHASRSDGKRYANLRAGEVFATYFKVRAHRAAVRQPSSTARSGSTSWANQASSPSPDPRSHRLVACPDSGQAAGASGAPSVRGFAACCAG